MGQGTDSSQKTEVVVSLSLEEHNAIVRATKIRDISEAVRHVITTGLWLMNLASFSLKKEAKEIKADIVPQRPHFIITDPETEGDGCPESIRKAMASLPNVSHDHHITKEQWIGYVEWFNGRGDAPISKEDSDDFWTFIADKQFVNSQGRTITRGNVHITFASWRQLRIKERRRDEEYKVENERQAKEAEDVHDRRNRFMLTDVPED